MGLIDRVLGGGRIEGIVDGASDLSEVFIPNATRAMELAAEIHQATLETAASEFQYAGDCWFDRMINGVNRLPRPFLALGTLGLFVYAMAEPVGFSSRMVGLQEVPEPLWWLLGAIVSFYFGARELHYTRAPQASGRPPAANRRRPLRERLGGIFRRSAPDPVTEQPDNPALSDWQRRD